MATTPPTSPTRPSELVRIEARALLELAIRLDGAMAVPFARATSLVLETISRKNRVIVLGVGKSGLIGRKIAATLRSTGTAAHFLQPSEALHGDLGMIAPGDLLLALSAERRGHRRTPPRCYPSCAISATRSSASADRPSPRSPRPPLSRSTAPSPPRPAP